MINPEQTRGRRWLTRWLSGEWVDVEFNGKCYDGCSNYVKKQDSGRVEGICAKTERNVLGCFDCFAITKDCFESRPPGSLCGVLLQSVLYTEELHKHKADYLLDLPMLASSQPKCTDSKAKHRKFNLFRFLRSNYRLPGRYKELAQLDIDPLFGSNRDE